VSWEQFQRRRREDQPPDLWLGGTTYSEVSEIAHDASKATAKVACCCEPRSRVTCFAPPSGATRSATIFRPGRLTCIGNTLRRPELGVSQEIPHVSLYSRFYIASLLDAQASGAEAHPDVGRGLDSHERRPTLTLAQGKSDHQGERRTEPAASHSRAERCLSLNDSKRMKCEDEIGASRAILRLTKDDLILPWLSSNLGCQSPREKIHKFC
jgi:hypothetical protein